MLLASPKFGVNYKAGQAFFTYTIGSPISKGIVFFSKRDIEDGILEIERFSHTGICTGYKEGVESHIGKGIQKVNLMNYFNDPKTRIFFREPVLLDKLGVATLRFQAYSRIGDTYDVFLIIGHALASIFFPWRHWILSKFNRSGSVCSEFVAWVYRTTGYMDIDGVKDLDDYEWKPQTLFNSPIFKPWKEDPYQCEGHDMGLNFMAQY